MLLDGHGGKCIKTDGLRLYIDTLPLGERAQVCVTPMAEVAGTMRVTFSRDTVVYILHYTFVPIIYGRACERVGAMNLISILSSSTVSYLMTSHTAICAAGRPFSA